MDDRTSRPLRGIAAQPNGCNGACPACCGSQHALRPPVQPAPPDDYKRLQFESELALLGLSTVGIVDAFEDASPTCQQCDGAGAWICSSCAGSGRTTERCLPCGDQGCAGCLCTECDGLGAENPCACVRDARPVLS